jgi:hypothetical protein
MSKTLFVCSQVALKLQPDPNSCESQCLTALHYTGINSDCVRMSRGGVWVVRLENRRPFTGLVSSNLTLSAICDEPLG